MPKLKLFFFQQIAIFNRVRPLIEYLTLDTFLVDKTKQLLGAKIQSDNCVVAVSYPYHLKTLSSNEFVATLKSRELLLSKL